MTPSVDFEITVQPVSGNCCGSVVVDVVVVDDVVVDSNEKTVPVPKMAITRTTPATRNAT
jgi:hypothetical protein